MVIFTIYYYSYNYYPTRVGDTDYQVASTILAGTKKTLLQEAQNGGHELRHKNQAAWIKNIGSITLTDG